MPSSFCMKRLTMDRSNKLCLEVTLPHCIYIPCESEDIKNCIVECIAWYTQEQLDTFENLLGPVIEKKDEEN